MLHDEPSKDIDKRKLTDQKGVSTVDRSKDAGKLIIAMTALGTVAQLVMVIAGHYNEFIRDNVFAIGGMAISLVFGALWAMKAAGSRGGAFGGGALVGGLCAIIGIAVSLALGDVPAAVLAFGTAGSAVAGGIGGIVLYALAGTKAAAA